MTGTAQDDLWRNDALCRQIGIEMFYPDPGEGNNIARYAKRVCLACPVRAACLQHAIENNEHLGIWGGLSERERRRFKRGEHIPSSPDLRPHGTTAAFQRHIRYGDTPCTACRKAWNTTQNQRYAARKTAAS